MRPYLLVSRLVQQLAQVVQAAGDGALVRVGVFEVLVGDVGAGQEGALGLFQPALVHLDDARVQVGRCGPRRDRRGASVRKNTSAEKCESTLCFLVFPDLCNTLGGVIYSVIVTAQGSTMKCTIKL